MTKFYSQHDGITGDALVAGTVEAMRRDGWMIAIHNDYRLSGHLHTFYLFTHPSGVWAKGEGETDAEAVMTAAEQAANRLNGVHRQLGAAIELVRNLRDAINQNANLDAGDDDEGSWRFVLAENARVFLEIM